MNRILAIVASSLFVGCALLGALAASAADPTACAQYANAAVHANQQNIQLGCGFTGPAWQSNFSNHYGWCLTVRDETASNETQKRDRALASCPRCKDYAAEAVAQNEQNVSRHCGFTGPAWQSNFNNHYGWCLNNAADAAESERAKRIQALAFCR